MHGAVPQLPIRPPGAEAGPAAVDGPLFPTQLAHLRLFSTGGANRTGTLLPRPVLVLWSCGLQMPMFRRNLLLPSPEAIVCWLEQSGHVAQGESPMWASRRDREESGLLRCALRNRDQCEGCIHTEFHDGRDTRRDHFSELFLKYGTRLKARKRQNVLPGTEHKAVTLSHSNTTLNSCRFIPYFPCPESQELRFAKLWLFSQDTVFLDSLARTIQDISETSGQDYTGYF
jgi:hypothetical protein